MKEEVYTGFKSENFLKKYVPVSQSQLVKKLNEIKIKPPLVLKIMSKQALHKTEIGGVTIVKNKSNLEKNFNDLISISKRKKIKLEGIMVQKYYEGEQIIIGIKKDNVFNHVILFGMGGIFTEVYEDTSIRKCPITLQDAQEMIDELKGKRVFYGFRRKKLNVNALKNTLVKISNIPKKHKNIQEMDINPFILNENEGVVVDARIVFSK